MKVSYVLTAILAAATSTIAGVVQTDDPAPTYKWRVLDSDSGTTPPGTNGTGAIEKRYGPQVVSCYNIGRAVQRGALTSSIDDFCNHKAIGQTLSSGQNLWTRYIDDFSGFTVLVWMEMTNGCIWTIDSACNKNFRLPVDGCNTDSTEDKQGGEMWDLCTHYRIDPGDRNSNDF